MPEESPVPGTEMKLRPELMLAVCRALNFDPGEFARRHAREFTRCYLRADKMLSYAGDVIAAYLGCRVNECLSKAEYALLSYMEYAGRERKDQDSDLFAHAVARYLKVRRQVGSDWVYAFEGEEAKARCLSSYPQMYAIAQAMYNFALESGEFKEVARTDGPEAWPNPRKVNL